MDIPAWVWFVIAAVAAIAGVALLLRDRSREGGGTNRERSRWAALRGWQYIESDEQLLEHWAGGAIAYYPEGSARDVVVGSTFTANGRRPVYVADSVRGGSADFVLVAVRCRRRLDAYLELWLPSVPFQREQMPDLLGPVGQRYAFVSDVEATRPLITSDLADAAEQVGGDVNVVWLEGYWVVAAAPPNCPSARLERLLRDLGELADLVDPFEEETGGARHDRRDTGTQPAVQAQAQPQAPPQPQAQQPQPHQAQPAAPTERLRPAPEPTEPVNSRPDTGATVSSIGRGRSATEDPGTVRFESERLDADRAAAREETELADTPDEPRTPTEPEEPAAPEPSEVDEMEPAEPETAEPEATETVAAQENQDGDDVPDMPAPGTHDVPVPPWQRVQHPD